MLERSQKPVFLTLLTLAFGSVALAFCGFYVAKADTDLFNESSKVILTRDGERTILTMSNDYQGEVSEFAMVVPIPYVFTEEQIRVGDPLIFERIDAYSAPRLVEYFDDDPCLTSPIPIVTEVGIPEAMAADIAFRGADALGVTIEEQFTVGEYDILILGAEESNGLETWLLENGYNLPEGASEALAPYIENDMKFFVARVNLEAFDEAGYQTLRPLMMAFESEGFMLPIQLGMLNAAGPQDLIVYLLSPVGRIELDNYRTVELPSNVNVPELVEEQFGDFYQAAFETAWEREGKDAAILEYAWDMAWCDPCAADPLSLEELRWAGVFWLDGAEDAFAPNVYLTRLHIRYDKEHFPEDLRFRVTENRNNFQGRYVIQRPWDGEISCEEGQAYVEQVQIRQREEARALANLTGWSFGRIMRDVDVYEPVVNIPDSWWDRVFDSLD